MALGSLLTVAAILAGLVIAAAGGFFLYMATRGQKRFFTPRLRRLALIERASLDGGRRLLLVRRDNTEHLIMIGGPIDLVVESNIQPVWFEETAADASAASHVAPFPGPPSLTDPVDSFIPGLKTAGPAEPFLPFPRSDHKEPEPDLLELTSIHEAKAAE